MKIQLFCTFTAALAVTASFGQQPAKDLIKPAARIINVRAIAFSADGQHLAACCGEPSDKGEVVVWDAKTHKVRWIHRIERGMPALAFSPDSKTLAVGSFGENCYAFEAASGKLRATLPGHGESARSVAFAPDGQTLAVGSYDKTISLWDWRAGKVTQTLEGQGDKVYALGYLPGGKKIISAGPSSSACVWDAANGNLLHKWDNRAWPLAFDPKGDWLVTAGNDASVTIRGIDDYDKSLAHYDEIYAYRILVIHPSAKFFAASSGFNTNVSIYPIDLKLATPADEKRSRELIALWDDASFDVREMASQELIRLGNVARPLLNKAAKEGASAEVRIRARAVLRSLGAPRPLAELPGQHESVLCASFSLDGQILAIGARDGLVQLWDAATFKRLASIQWPNGER